MTPKQKHHQRQRLHQQARNAAKESERTKKRKLNDDRRERRHWVSRGLATTQPQYHEKLRKEANDRQVLHLQHEKERLAKRRDRQRRKVAVMTALLTSQQKEAA